MGIEYWWNDTNRGKPEKLEEKPVPIPTLSFTNPT
jgi:hypothetical protein